MVQYCTTLDVIEELNWLVDQPEFVSGQAPILEEADISGTLMVSSIIYLDHASIVDGTLTLYSGADANSLTELTEGVDYSINLDKAKITILSVATIGTDNIYAEYGYIQIDGRPAFTDSFISKKIDRATELFDGLMRRSYQPPVIVAKEEYIGKGVYDLKYRTKHLNPVFLQLNLTTELTAIATTMVLEDTTGLVADEYITINTEVVKIVSVDSSTELTIERGLYDTVGLVHAVDSKGINMVVMVSDTPSGSTPVFYLSRYQSDYEISFDTNYITFLPNGLGDSLYAGKNAPNRLQLTYKYGSETIPSPINQACVEQVTRWMTSAAIAKGLIEGVDGFVPRANEVLGQDIKEILSQYKLILMDGN